MVVTWKYDIVRSGLHGGYLEDSGFFAQCLCYSYGFCFEREIGGDILYLTTIGCLVCFHFYIPSILCIMKFLTLLHSCCPIRYFLVSFLCVVALGHNLFTLVSVCGLCNIHHTVLCIISTSLTNKFPLCYNNNYMVQICYGITSGRVLNGELTCTKITEFNFPAFAYRLFHNNLTINTLQQNSFPSSSSPPPVPKNTIVPIVPTSIHYSMCSHTPPFLPLTLQQQRLI